MKKEEVEVYSEATNAVVIRNPSRRFPGVLVQGDSLFALHEQLDELIQSIARRQDVELLAEAKGLLGQLSAYLTHYEAVLQDHGVSLPYHRSISSGQ